MAISPQWVIRSTHVWFKGRHYASLLSVDAHDWILEIILLKRVANLPMVWRERNNRAALEEYTIK